MSLGQPWCQLGDAGLELEKYLEFRKTLLLVLRSSRLLLVGTVGTECTKSWCQVLE